MSNSRNKARNKAIKIVKGILSTIESKYLPLPQNTAPKDIEYTLFFVLGMVRSIGCQGCGSKKMPYTEVLDLKSFENMENLKAFREYCKKVKLEYKDALLVMRFTCRTCKNTFAIAFIVKREGMYGSWLIRNKPKWDADYTLNFVMGVNIFTPASWFDYGWRFAKTNILNQETS